MLRFTDLHAIKPIYCEKACHAIPEQGGTSVKFVGVSCSPGGVVDYITNREKAVNSLLCG